MFASLRIQLAIAIAVAFLCLLSFLYVFTQRGFDQDFLDLVSQRQLERLTPLKENLIELYEKNEDWPTPRSILFRQTIVSSLESARLGPGSGPHPRSIVILDAQQKVLYGLNRQNRPLLRSPIEIRGQTVGYLAIPAIGRVPEGLERIFQERQTRRFMITALLVALGAIAFAWIFSARFLKPINDISAAVQDLAKGDRHIQLDTMRGSELARLRQDVLHLAQQLKEHETRQEQWLLDIAHELRTPMTVLRGEVEAMIDGVRQADIETLDSLLDEIKHISRLIDDLNELSTIESSALSLNIQPLDIETRIKSCLGVFSSALEAKKHQVSLERISSEPVTVRADATRLNQVLENILSNTLRYADIGAELKITLRESQTDALITIEDSGPGFNGDHERLFERLFQADSARTRSEGSRGLGLAIVRSITEAHGGQISAHPSVLGGLALEIRWPKA